jgi:hypothetical protein
MLHIDWKRLPGYPAQGPEGPLASNGGWIDETSVLSSFGYAAGGAFTNSTWMLNVSSRSAVQQWKQLPSAPVTPRQDVGATKVADAFYFVGGFSYTSPYTYKEVLGLHPIDRSPWWEWIRLPDFPHPIATYTGVVSVGSKIYVVGGMDYDGKAFYVDHDRNNGTLGLGKRLYCFDTASTENSWQRLPDLPSVARWVQSVSVIGQSIFVIGGATGSNPQHKITTVTDNWKYDTLAGTWTQLSSLPVASGNFNSDTVFMDRYILLIGGYQYANVTLTNGTVIPSFGNPQRMCKQDSKPHCRQGCAADVTSESYYNDIFVYDTKTDTYGIATATSKAEPCLLPPGCGPYPLNANVPQASVRGNRIFSLGGETDPRKICGTQYQHYPTLAMLGEIEVINVDMQ